MFGGYEDVTYEPLGRSWFVVIGYHGDQIYYEKVIFSCGDPIVNIIRKLGVNSSNRS